jgi:hypothetical protein
LEEVLLRLMSENTVDKIMTKSQKKIRRAASSHRPGASGATPAQEGGEVEILV